MRNTNESDLALPPDTGMPIIRGVVGWNSSDEHADVGTDSDDGHTFVRVTRFDGKSISKDPLTNAAQGHEILCQVMGPLYYIPPKGTVVLVAFPDGHAEAPGAGVILGTIGGTPAVQFSETRAVLDMGEGTDLIVKGKSVTMTDHASPAQFMQVGPPPQGGTSGITACDSAGGGFTVQAGVVGLFSGSGGSAPTLVQITTTSFEVWQSSGSVIKLEGGNFMTSGTTCSVKGSAVYLGNTPDVSSPVLWGLTGTAGLPSPYVFVSKLV